VNASPQPPATPPPPAPPPPAAAAPYPVNLEIAQQAEYHRWLPLVKWLLLIPHYIALVVVGLIAEVCILIGFFAVLFTGQWPAGLFNLVAGAQRWGYRVAAYLLLLTDDDPNYPLRYTIEYPAGGVDRWRVLQIILAYPVLLVAEVVLYIVFLLLFVPFFAILFTQKYPEGLFNLARGGLRLMARGQAYQAFMVTRYPPFDLS
jgi:hypothetical protein